MPLDSSSGATRRAGSGGFLASLFGGNTGKTPSRSRTKRRQGILGELYLPALIPLALLVAYGLVVVWSASLTISDASVVRQGVGAAIGLVGAIAIWRYDYRAISNLTNVLLAIDIVLILLPNVPGLGVEGGGMTGWVRLPLIPFNFQPSEVAKIVTIFLMASATSQYNGRIDDFKEYAKLCGILCVPLFLLLIQDLGTGLVILFLGAAIIICGGAKRSWVLATIGIIVGAAALVVASSMTDGLPHILKEYQLKRLIVFVDPSVDPTGDGYNLQQAQIAVGSGGLFGKGIGNATQAGQGFLPEAHTDFVFALLSEEFGFIGALVLLALFAALIFSTILLAMRIEAPFGKLCLVGVVAMWSFQLLENIGMCLGMMPITGIPLPFISYGASSMVVQLIAGGIVQSVYAHRTKAA